MVSTYLLYTRRPLLQGESVAARKARDSRSLSGATSSGPRSPAARRPAPAPHEHRSAARASSRRPAPPAEAPEVGEPRTATRQRLVDAALGLFAERGFAGATTAQIAARAGVAEKTLFANFGSKERLYQATLEPATILALMVPEAIRTLEPLLASPPDDPRALLRAILENRVRFARAHPREVQLLAQHVLRRPEAVLTLVDNFRRRIEPMFRPTLGRLVARGALRRDIPLGTIARMVVTSVVGYVFTRVVLLPDLDWDDAQEIERMVEVLASGIVPAGAPAVRPRARR